MADDARRAAVCDDGTESEASIDFRSGWLCSPWGTANQSYGCFTPGAGVPNRLPLPSRVKESGKEIKVKLLDVATEIKSLRNSAKEGKTPTAALAVLAASGSRSSGSQSVARGVKSVSSGVAAREEFADHQPESRPDCSSRCYRRRHDWRLRGRGGRLGPKGHLTVALSDPPLAGPRQFDDPSVSPVGDQATGVGVHSSSESLAQFAVLAAAPTRNQDPSRRSILGPGNSALTRATAVSPSAAESDDLRIADSY